MRTHSLESLHHDLCVREPGQRGVVGHLFAGNFRLFDETKRDLLILGS